VGHTTVSQNGLWLAAVLAVGEKSALSHRSAASLWRLTDVHEGPIEVIIGNGTRRRSSGLRIHRSTCLTVRQGIPVTTVARTLVDLATRVSKRDVREALYRAESLRLLDRAALGRCLESAGTRRGSGVLRDLLEQGALPLTETRSALEQRFLRFCKARGLPIPALNALIGEYTVDCLWRGANLVVELDSWEFHRDRESFEADRRRDAQLQTSGFRIARVTDRRIKRAGDELEAELRALLGLTRSG
jgi:very-short-patch-repair endonuclease